MRKGLVKVTLAMLSILLIFVINVMALAPTTMVYQGRLADPEGNPITDPVEITFTIHVAPDSDPGTFVWAETITDIDPDDQGVFTVELGITNPLTTTVFNGEARFLGIMVTGDDIMTPYQLLSSAPYAISATPPTTFNDVTNFRNRVIIGDTPTYNSLDELHVHGSYNSSTFHYGIVTDVEESSSGGILALYAESETDGSPRYGMYSVCSTKDQALNTGISYGIYALAQDGASAYGIYASASGATTNYAGYFSGNINVTGIVVKSAELSRIDHPTDPANKYLYHSAVESPDMMNVYNGNITTDANGVAIVELPDYFKALNKDFRYQLTVIGDFAQAIIGEEISNNQFTIQTDKPAVKVSWQVTGVRKDAFAEAHRIQVEVEKPDNEKGLYLHPEAFKLGPEMQIHYQQNLEAREVARQASGDGHE